MFSGPRLHFLKNPVQTELLYIFNLSFQELSYNSKSGHSQATPCEIQSELFPWLNAKRYPVKIVARELQNCTGWFYYFGHYNCEEEYEPTYSDLDGHWLSGMESAVAEWP